MKIWIKWISLVTGAAIIGMVGLGFVAGQHPKSPIGRFVHNIEAIQYRGDIEAVKAHKFAGQNVTIGEFWQELAGVNDIRWDAFGNVVMENGKKMPRNVICVETWLKFQDKPVHVQYLYNRKTKGVEFSYLSYNKKTMPLLSFLLLLAIYGGAVQ